MAERFTETGLLLAIPFTYVVVSLTLYLIARNVSSVGSDAHWNLLPVVFYIALYIAIICFLL